MGAVGGERVVVAVEDGDGTGGDEGVHGGGLLGVGTDGEEALPVGMAGGGRARLSCSGEAETWMVSMIAAGEMRASSMAAEGETTGTISMGSLVWVGDGRVGGGEVERQNLVDGQVLRGEDAVETFKGERAFAVEEVRDMGLLEAGLLGEAAAGKGAAFDAAHEFDAKEFVEVLKVQ